MIKQYNGPALGLTRKSTEEEIKDRVFEAIHDTGYMIFCTIGADGVTPTNRGLEVHYLDDSGDLFIGLCPGKPVYDELKRNPRVSAGLIVSTVGRLTYGIRLNAIVEEVDDEKIMTRYWELNPGTAKLYRRAPYNFVIFRLKCGDGEIFDVYEDDALLRFRFGFGGTSARSWYYTISNKCTGCGECADKCMTQVIEIIDGKASIDYPACLECGVCHSVCPIGAVVKNEGGKSNDIR